jgi:hypothetical protein
MQSTCAARRGPRSFSPRRRSKPEKGAGGYRRTPAQRRFDADALGSGEITPVSGRHLAPVKLPELRLGARVLGIQTVSEQRVSLPEQPFRR